MKKINYGSLIILIFLMLFSSCKKDSYNNLVTEAGSNIDSISEIFVCLNASDLKEGETGEWSVKSGLVDSKVYFEDKNKPKTKFYGLPGQKYILVWKISDSDNQTEDKVEVSFNPIKVVINTSNSYYSTRMQLSTEGNYKVKWTITGDFDKIISEQNGGVSIPVDEFPVIKIYGKENGIIHIKLTLSYGSVSASDSIIMRTGNYNEYEALEDLGFPYIKIENGHVVEINMVGNIYGKAFNDFSFVPSLRAFKYIKKLDLSSDGISVFSSSIPLYYKNLEYLNLSSNKISQIPANIGELKKLKTLMLDHQQEYAQIRELPDDFCNLESLNYVDLSSNNISDLPSAIGNLKNLKTLNLWGSTLNSLPTSIGNLSMLEYFIVDGVKSNLPESFCQMSNLRSFGDLNGPGSTMTKLPDNIGNLKKLKQLFLLGNNSFQTLPASICELDSLKELYIHSMLSELPANFGNLKSLELLVIGADITRLPQSFTDLSALKDLSIIGSSDKSAILTLPEDLDKLSNMEGISIQDIKLKWIPASIGKLPKLGYIGVRNCFLDSVPASIGNL